MKNTRKFIYLAVAAIGFAALSLTGCPTPDVGGPGTETGKETVATPKADPAAGAVKNGENLTLTSATEGAEIWYTTDGKAPAKNGEGSTKYTGPFSITPPVTVKAIAIKDGMNDSGILTASYTLQTGGSSPENAIELTEDKWSDGNLTSTIGEQWFKFTATANTQYIHAGFGTMSSLFGYHVQVYDSNVDKIGTESNLQGAATSANRYVSISVTPGEEYYIKVRRYSSTTNGNGTYQIAFNTSSAAPAVTVPLPSNATPLTENIWADGNFTASEGEQWFKFAATADTQYIHAAFGTLSSTMGMYVQVYDSSGAAVGSETNLWNSKKYVSMTVTPGQEYYIKVRRYSSTSNGTYQIAFNTSSTAPSATVTMPSNATPLTENRWADGELTSSIGEQWFKFTATADTQYIHAGFGTMSFSFGYHVQVYDANGDTVGIESNLQGAASSANRYVSRSVTPGEEYYIRVRRYSSTTNGNGTYQIAFNTSSTAPSVTVTIPSGAITLTENTWTDGYLTTSNSEQWFKFIATAGTQYIHASFGTLDSTMGIYIQVYDSNGASVGTESNLFGTYARSVSRSVTPVQEYYIKVRRYSSTYNGTYQIAFNTSSAAPSATVMPPAIPLTENIWSDGNLTSSSEQWFKFTATTDTQYIHVSFGTLSPSIGMYVQVYNSSNATVGSETNLWREIKNISRSVTPGQVYYIKVRPYDPSYTGTYNIAFNTSSTAPSTTITLPSSASTLTENTWANSSITTSISVQWFKFTATASTQYIHAAFSTIFTVSGINVQVYDSNGVSVGTDSNLCGTGSESFISLNVTQGQTYYIRVWPNVLTGTYQIAFNKSSTAPGITLPSSATQLTVNTWANRNFSALDDKQWFRFTATADTQYIHFGSDRFVYVQVYDSSGVKVGDMDLLAVTSTYIPRSVTNGLVYYIQVWPALDTGTYKIAFNTSPTAPSP
jgi:hypothetical protein